MYNTETFLFIQSKPLLKKENIGCKMQIQQIYYMYLKSDLNKKDSSYPLHK